MDEIIDFSNCKRIYRNYGGSDRKFSVEYNDEVYLLKFSGDHAKRHDISTSAVNNVVSEYISSHISASMGLPTHQTYLGVYHDEIVVGCKDFRKSGEQNMEFSELIKSVYDSRDITRHVLLQQIYETLCNPINALPQSLITASIERFWDTFVVDALVGNFDRHTGNWGFLIANDKIHRLAPVYDYGSTLFPNLSDEGADALITDDFEMLKRCIVFPSPVLCVTREKVGKVGYYDMLSSNYDKNCTLALLRMASMISLDAINKIIDETPLITETRKIFYKSIIALRKKVIIDRAYEKCLDEDYDKESVNHIYLGIQRTDKDINALLNDFHISEYLQTLNRTAKYNADAQSQYKRAKRGKGIKTDFDDI